MVLVKVAQKVDVKTYEYLSYLAVTGLHNLDRLCVLCEI